MVASKRFDDWRDGRELVRPRSMHALCPGENQLLACPAIMRDAVHMSRRDLSPSTTLGPTHHIPQLTLELTERVAELRRHRVLPSRPVGEHELEARQVEVIAPLTVELGVLQRVRVDEQEPKDVLAWLREPEPTKAQREDLHALVHATLDRRPAELARSDPFELDAVSAREVCVVSHAEPPCGSRPRDIAGVNVTRRWNNSSVRIGIDGRTPMTSNTEIHHIRMHRYLDQRMGELRSYCAGPANTQTWNGVWGECSGALLATEDQQERELVAERLRRYLTSFIARWPTYTRQATVMTTNPCSELLELASLIKLIPHVYEWEEQRQLDLSWMASSVKGLILEIGSDDEARWALALVKASPALEHLVFEFTGSRWQNNRRATIEATLIEELAHAIPLRTKSLVIDLDKMRDTTMIHGQARAFLDVLVAKIPKLERLESLWIDFGGVGTEYVSTTLARVRARQIEALGVLGAAPRAGWQPPLEELLRRRWPRLSALQIDAISPTLHAEITHSANLPALTKLRVDSYTAESSSARSRPPRRNWSCWETSPEAFVLEASTDETIRIDRTLHLPPNSAFTLHSAGLADWELRRVWLEQLAGFIVHGVRFVRIQAEEHIDERTYATLISYLHEWFPDCDELDLATFSQTSPNFTHTSRITPTLLRALLDSPLHAKLAVFKFPSTYVQVDLIERLHESDLFSAREIEWYANQHWGISVDARKRLTNLQDDRFPEAPDRYR